MRKYRRSEASPVKATTRGVRVASPFHFRPRDVAEAFRLLGRRDLGWDKLITSRAGLDDVPAVFERLGDGREIKCAIVPEAADR